MVHTETAYKNANVQNTYTKGFYLSLQHLLGNDTNNKNNIIHNMLQNMINFAYQLTISSPALAGINSKEINFSTIHLTAKNNFEPYGN